MSVPHSKRGWLVPAVWIAALAGVWYATRPLRTGSGPSMTWAVGAAAGSAVAGVVLILLGRRFRRLEGRVLWDPRRERYTHLPSGDTFFWIDVGHWGWIVIVLGALLGWSIWRDIPK